MHAIEPTSGTPWGGLRSFTGAIGVYLTAYVFSLTPFAALLLFTGFVLHAITGGSWTTAGPWETALRSGLLILFSLACVAATSRVHRLIRNINGTEERYRLVVEEAAEGILILDKAGEFEVNYAACRMVGCEGSCPGRRNCPHYAQIAEAARWAAGGVRESQVRRLDGIPMLLEATVSRLGDGRMIAILRDITARRRAEVALQLSEQRHRLLFERSMVGLFRISPNGVCTDCNTSFARTMGYHSPCELLGLKTCELFAACHPLPDFTRLREEGDLLSLEIQVDRMGGGKGWALLNLVVVGGNRAAPEGLAGTLVDLTASKESEKELRALLSEKEELLREVHHRVKNNLQIIDSLLSFECGPGVERTALEGYQRARDRVNSIALVHRMIYCSSDLAQVDFREYVQQVSTHLWSCYRERAANVNFVLRVETGGVDLDTAILCGLIINELVSNSLKHAFPGGRSGEIRIELTQTSGQRRLTVSDNGVGLPHGFSLNESDGLGLHLVHSLASQLGGAVEVTSVDGTWFEIAFTPRRSKAEAVA